MKKIYYKSSQKHKRHFSYHQSLFFLFLGLIVAFFCFKLFTAKKNSSFVNSPPIFNRKLFGPWLYQAEIKNVLAASLGKDSQNIKVQVEKDQSQLEFYLPVENASLSPDKEKVIFSSPDKIIEVSYQMISNGIKEEIIFKKIPAINQFKLKMKLNNLYLRTTADNTPVFFDKNGQYQFHFERPFVKDGAGAVSYAVKYIIQPIKNNDEPIIIPTPSPKEITDGKKSKKLLDYSETMDYQDYLLTIELDQGWLADPKRVLPLVIDPTVVHSTSSDFATGVFNRVSDTGSGSSPSLETYYHELPADINTVGLWHMNETSGSTVADASGNNNNGTATGTTIVDGKFGKARSFNGTSDYISLGSIPKPSLPITIEAWVSPNSTTPVGIFDSAPGVPDVLRNYPAGYVEWWNAAPSIALNLQANQWQHIAFVYSHDGTNRKIDYYKNGVLQTSASAAGSSTFAWTTFILGNINSGTAGWYSGQIDEVRISNVARTPEEIKQNAQRFPYAVYTSPVVDLTNGNSILISWNSLGWTAKGVRTTDGETPISTSGLVAQWNFNETSGTTAASGGSCGSSCNGTLTNFANTSGQDVLAGSGWTAANRRWGAGALMFDGSNDYVETTNSWNDPRDPFTWESWFFNSFTLNTSMPPSYYIIMGAFIDSNNRDQLYYDKATGNLRFSIGVGGSFTATISYNTSIIPGWHHVAVTRNSNTWSLYLDGLQVATNTNSTNSASGNRKTEIGRDGAGYYFTGVIDSTRIYSRALTAAEVLANYQAGQIEIQTRTSADNSTWEAWKPITGETQIDSLDNNESATRVYNWTFNNISTNQTWAKYDNTIPSNSDTTSTNGRIPLGTSGRGDSVHIHTPSIIKDGSTYKMWYSGYDGSNWRIYYATSSDGLTWTKYDNTIPSNSNTSSTNGRIPLGTSGRGDSGGAAGPKVIKDGSTYKMWYNGYDGTNWRVYYATSSDGLTWTKYDNTIPSNSNTSSTNGRIPLGTSGRGDNVHTYSAHVIKDGSTYKMWYGGYDGTYIRIYYATSSDGLTWTKYDNTIPSNSDTTGTNGRIPLGTSGKGDTWDTWGSLVLKEGSVYKMWYRGGDYAGYKYYYATSFDGLTWTKYDNTIPSNSNTSSTNGRIPFGTSGRGDVSGVESITGLKDGNVYKVWYSGFDGTNRRIYHAIMTPLPANQNTDTTTKIEGSASEKFSFGVPQVDGKTVGLWHLEETSGTGAYLKDSTANGNHGTPTGTTVVNGRFGKARSFNGSSDLIDFNSTFSSLTNNFTISLWVNPGSSQSQYANIFGNSGGCVNYCGFVLQQNSTTTNQYYFAWGDGSAWQYTGNFNLTPNVWQHIAVTKTSSSGTTVYVNGVSVATSASNTNVATSTYTLKLGQGYAGGGRYWNGVADEFKIDNTVRTPEEIAESYRAGRDHRLSRTISSVNLSSATKIPFYIAADRPGTYLEVTIGESAYANYEPDTNTVGLWHLEEQSGSGAYIKDSSGNANNGTPTGTTSVQGKIGKARSFNGTSNYIATPDNGLPSGNNPFTVSAWVKTTASYSLNNYAGVFLWGTKTTGQAIYLGIGNDANISPNACFIGAHGDATSTITPINDGQWHHCVGVYDGTKYYIYLDGQLKNSKTLSVSTNIVKTGTAYIGNFNAAYYWNGQIDEVSVSNTARSADEIRQAYEIGRRTHPITIDFVTSPYSTYSSGTTVYLKNPYGTTNLTDTLKVGDTLIFKENVNGTETVGQATVTSITNTSTTYGTVTLDAAPSFPSGGYSTNTTVFKWQREYFDITGSLSGHRDATTRITIRLTDASQGANFWLDDFRYNSNYLYDNTPDSFDTATGVGTYSITSIPSTLNRYFQYRVIFSSWDTPVSPQLTSVTLNYTSNAPPNTPTLDQPTNGATNQSLTPSLKTTATDPDGDWLRYKIQLCTDAAMTQNCQTFDQTSSQTGWSGQNTQSGTAYTSGTQTTYTIQTSLAPVTTYFWRSYAIDPAGSNIWSSTQSTPYSFSTTPLFPPASFVATVADNQSQITLNWTNVNASIDGYTLEKSTDGGAFTSLYSPGPSDTSYVDTNVSSGHTYQYRLRANFSSYYSDWALTSVLSLGVGNFKFEGIKMEGIKIK